MSLITEPSQGALLSEVTPPLRLPEKKKKKPSASDWEQEPVLGVRSGDGSIRRLVAEPPPCVSAGNGSGIRCGVCGEFHPPERTRAEVLLRSAQPVPSGHLRKTVVRQSGGAVQGVSAAS